MSKFNSHAEFQQLKEVVVGQGYPPEYFDHIEDQEVRENLQKIFIEIEEDFQSLITTLDSFGVTSTRPPLVSKEQFENDPKAVPPLTPRDRQVVLNEKMVLMNQWDTWQPLHEEFRKQDPDNIVEMVADTDGANASCIFKLKNKMLKRRF